MFSQKLAFMQAGKVSWGGERTLSLAASGQVAASQWVEARKG